MDDVSRLEVQLLDVNGEHVAAEWRFGSLDGSVVRVGRAQDNDVIISDRYVSRYHAEICFVAGAWHVLSLGRHGMFRAGVAIQKSHRLGAGSQDLQLGGTGVILRVNVDTKPLSEEAPHADVTTMLFASSPAFEISIDEEDKSRTLDEITNGEFFQALRVSRRRLAERDALRTDG